MTRKAVSITLAWILTLALAAGCSKAPAPAAPATGGPAPAPAQPASPAKPAPATPSGPKQGGTLTILMAADVVSFDPQTLVELISGTVNLQIFERLVEIDPGGQFVPGLAESWTTAPDGLSWTFKLRKGVKFHDGTDFDANAVVTNMKRILDPKKKGLRRDIVENVTEVTAVDSHTVKMVTKGPDGSFLAKMAYYPIAMISPAALAKWSDEEIRLHPVGTGPFKFVKWTPADSAVLERNDAYWKGRPNLDRVIFKPVPEPATRLMMLQSGEAEFVTNVPPVDVNRLQNVKGLEVIIAPFTRIMYLQINGSKQPFQDIRVRQAISHAIDRQAIVKTVMNGLAEVATAPIGSRVYGYANVGNQGYDKQKALQLLKDAGYPNGFETTIVSPDGRYPMDKETAEAIQAQLAQVGIKAKVQVMEWAALNDYLKKSPADSKFELAVMGFSPGNNDADHQLYTHYHSSMQAPKSFNRSYTADAEIDKLLDAARSTVDQKARLELFARAQKMIIDRVPEAFLHELKQIFAISTKVKGFTPLPVELIDLRPVWKD